MEPEIRRRSFMSDCGAIRVIYGLWHGDTGFMLAARLGKTPTNLTPSQLRVLKRTHRGTPNKKTHL
jgi:hypothetical protein